ncbi:MAG: hypothetical protein ACYDBX_03815 [Patescibacteria group bacterium]
MDTSKEYIKMCEKADEIQRKWEWGKGDYYYSKYGIYTDILLNKDYINAGKPDAEERNADEYIWLPRQDQLQEMMFPQLSTGLSVHYTFADFIDENYLHYPVEMAKEYDKLSMEQLWLMYVMKEKFNKTWNEDKWI